MMEQCKLPIEVDEDPKHTLFCIKDKDHEGLHQVWLMPLSMYIKLTIKEYFLYRLLKIQNLREEKQ